LERNYVVICNRHKGIAGSLLFWGYYTNDDAKRSFSGYTSNLNECERYEQSIIRNGERGYKFPIYGVDFTPENWRKQDDFAIRIDQLNELGYRPMLIYYR
jgi:hypothetical protein